MNLLVLEVEVCINWIFLKSNKYNDDGSKEDDGDEDGYLYFLCCCVVNILLCILYGFF